MPAPLKRTEVPAGADVLEAFANVSEALESGSGLPEVTRACSRALNASLVVIDPSSSVLAVACASPDDERAVLSRAAGTETLELRVADSTVGQLRLRPRGVPPSPAVLRTIVTLIALEVERSRAPGRASEAAVADFLRDVLDRKLTDRDAIVARAGELGADGIGAGASVIVVRARPQHPEEGDWRARVLAMAARGARAVAAGSLAAPVSLASAAARRRPQVASSPTARQSAAPDTELVIVVPGAETEIAGRAAAAVHRELELNATGYVVVVARSRVASDPADLHRAGSEAVLAANVAEAQGHAMLAFDETGAYRLLLPAMSQDPGELQRFYDETVAPLVAYDEQYETDLLRTLETFLDADGTVAKTAEKLFTHRHTIRYRLERVRELSGLDVSSTDGRERLGLGLKAMRVLGIHSPHGPAAERGAAGGRVRREGS